MEVIGQIHHEMRWFTWHDPAKEVDEIEFACTCGVWKCKATIDPIAAFHGTVLKFAGRSLGVEVLKAGISAGRGFQEHLETAQLDVVLTAGL